MIRGILERNPRSGFRPNGITHFAFATPRKPVQDCVTRAPVRLLGPCFKTGRIPAVRYSSEIEHVNTEDIAGKCFYVTDGEPSLLYNTHISSMFPSTVTSHTR